MPCKWPILLTLARGIGFATFWGMDNAVNANTGATVKTTQMEARHVQPGSIVHHHGYRWVVRENRYDPLGYGGNGHNPRHILICDAANPEDVATLGYYAHKRMLRYPVTAPVTVEVTQ
jgi:hypothetical protein